MSGLRIGLSNHPEHRDRPFYLPPSAVTQTFGILAKRRGGKSYTAAVVAEEFAAAKVPWVMLDPTGAHYGLRSSADGQRPGIAAVILGGAHGDAPLEATGGKVVADLVVDHPGWYVLDLEAFESGAAQDRFVGDFAERLYRRKAKTRDPMHLFIDEADSFMPQRPGPNQLAMLGAFESIVRRGGIRGLGTTIISQRAAVVNKNVLTQLDTLIVLQTTGPQDQDAEIDWVKRNAAPAQLTEFKDSLASLPRGMAWVYSPENGIFERVVIRERRTFNSSATPEMGDKVTEPARLAKVDLEAVKAAMAATIERAKADDPRLLRARIVELESQLRKAATERIEVRVEVPVLTEADKAMLVEAWMNGVRAATQLDEASERIAAAMRPLLRPLGAPHSLPPAAPRPEPDRARDRAPAVEGQARSGAPSGESADRTRSALTATLATRQHQDVGGAPPSHVDEEEATVDRQPLRAGARKMLDVLARHHPLRLTKAQLGTLAGMAHTGGTFNNYLSTMRRYDYVFFEGDALALTAAGLDAAGVLPGNPMTADEVRDRWRRSLRAGARAMFDVLVDRYPESVSREQLGEAAGLTHNAGTFGNYLSTLRRNGLVEVRDGQVSATATAVGQL